jgi:hypothetical protein
LTEHPLHKLTAAETYAFMAKTYGEEWLRKMFELPKQFGGLFDWRESVERDIEELRSVGLDNVAEIMTEYLPDQPKLYDEKGKLRQDYEKLLGSNKPVLAELEIMRTKSPSDGRMG